MQKFRTATPNLMSANFCGEAIQGKIYPECYREYLCIKETIFPVPKGVVKVMPGDKLILLIASEGWFQYALEFSRARIQRELMAA